MYTAPTIRIDLTKSKKDFLNDDKFIIKYNQNIISELPENVFVTANLLHYEILKKKYEKKIQSKNFLKSENEKLKEQIDVKNFFFFKFLDCSIISISFCLV